MGLNGQRSGFLSRISYLLVLLASLVAFDCEPAGAFERMAPAGSYSLDFDADDSVPGPDDQGLAPSGSPIFGNDRTGLSAANEVADAPRLPARWSYHFLVRGPPPSLS